MRQLLLLAINIEDLMIGFALGIILTIIFDLALLKIKKNRLKEENHSLFSSLRMIEHFQGLVYQCQIDEFWTMNYMSQGSFALLGYRNDQIIDNQEISFRDIIHPDYRDEVDKVFGDAINHHQDVTVEYLIITKDNQEKWVREEAYIVYDEDQKPVCIEGFIYEIGFEKDVLKSLHQIRRQYDTLFNGLDMPLIVVTKDQIIDVNPSALAFFRATSKNDLLSKQPLDLIGERYHELYHENFKRIQETKTGNLSTHYPLKRCDGTKVMANIEGVPFFEDGEMTINILLVEKSDDVSFDQPLVVSDRHHNDLLLYMQEGLAVFTLMPEVTDAKLSYANRNFSYLLYGDYRHLTYQTLTSLFTSLKLDDLVQILSAKIDEPIKKEIFLESQRKYLRMQFYYNLETDLIIQITDITQEKSLYQQYQEEKAALDQILESTDTMIWVWDLENDSIEIDQRTYDKLGYGDQLKITKPTEILDYFHEDDRIIFQHQLDAYFNQEIPYFSVEIRMKDASNQYHWWMVRGRATKLKDDYPTKISGTFQDITIHKQKEEEIKYLVLHDQLTDLYNFRAYTDKMISLDQDQYWPISLAIVDVNGLKVFNDALSHSTGDELLVKTAKVMKRFVGEKDFLARIGGDEFIMIMPNTPLGQAEARFIKIEEALSKEMVHQIPISISYGVDVKFNDRFTLHQIKDMADSKMYQQKFSGKDTRLQILDQIRHQFFSINVFEGKVVTMVHQLAMKFVEELKLDQETVNVVDIASQYYNIGIFSIRQSVFNDQRTFKRYEEIEYRKHVETGYRIMLATYRHERIALAILHHHEKYDGSGYPAKIKGNQIPIASRIISILATYSRRTLLNEDENDIIAYIVAEKHHSFDPELVDRFISMIQY